VNCTVAGGFDVRNVIAALIGCYGVVLVVGWSTTVARP
jgi:hypothetical protein